MHRYLHLQDGFWYSLLIHGVIFTLLFIFSTQSIINTEVFRQIAEFRLEDTPVKRDQASSPPQKIKSAAKVPPQDSPAKPIAKPSPSIARGVMSAAPLEPELKRENDGGQAAAKTSQTKEPAANDVSPQAPVVPLDQPSTIEPPRSAAISLADQPQKTVIAQAEGAEFAGAWGAYGRNLTQACLKFRRYPAAAAAGGVRGAVYVAIRIRADGVSEIYLRRSSGFKVLDEEALRMVEQATRAVPIPDALKNKSKELIIPIGFEM